MCSSYCDEALKERHCRNWFAKFHCGDFLLEDENRCGRPVDVDDDLIKSIIDVSCLSTKRKMAEKFYYHIHALKLT